MTGGVTLRHTHIRFFLAEFVYGGDKATKSISLSVNVCRWAKWPSGYFGRGIAEIANLVAVRLELKRILKILLINLFYEREESPINDCVAFLQHELAQVKLRKKTFELKLKSVCVILVQHLLPSRRVQVKVLDLSRKEKLNRAFERIHKQFNHLRHKKFVFLCSLRVHMQCGVDKF